MKRLLQILPISAFVLAATYYFSVDGIIRSMVEKEASKALKAQVNIANANFRLFDGELTLDGVQFTNPSAPLRNLMQADSISLNLDLTELLTRKFVADHVEIHGLRLDQARSGSGAIAGLTPELAPPSAPFTQAPNAQQAPQYAQGNAAPAHSPWQQRLQFLADESNVRQLRERANQLRAARSPIAQAQLRQEVQAQLGQLQSLREELNRDTQRAQYELINTSSGNSFGQPAGQDTRANAGNTHPQLSRHIEDSLNRLLALSASVRSSATQGNDQWFALARKVFIDGEYEFGAQPLRFEANIDNATPQPAFWKLPMTFSINGKPDQAAGINATGSLDLIGANGQVNFTLNQIPVTGLQLGNEAGVDLLLDKAIASGDGQVLLADNQVDIKINARFQQVQLSAAAADNTRAQTVTAALRGVSDFDLDVLANGAAQNPVVNVRSSIARQLAASVATQSGGDIERARQLLAAREQALHEIARGL